VAILDSVGDEFVDRNEPLHLVLGLISLGRRLDAHLPDAPGAEPEAPAGPPSATETPGGDPLLHLLLGLVSLRRTLLSELAPLRIAQEAPGEAQGAGPAAPPRHDLLR
jgi:hypothetical protein